MIQKIRLIGLLSHAGFNVSCVINALHREAVFSERPLTWTCRFHSPLHTLSHLFPGQPIAGVMLLFELVAWLLYHLWATSIGEASD